MRCNTLHISSSTGPFASEHSTRYVLGDSVAVNSRPKLTLDNDISVTFRSEKLIL